MLGARRNRPLPRLHKETVMTLRYLACAVALDTKAVSENGVFEGYASVFGERDLGGDIVEAGAFTKSLKLRGHAGIKMLADHESAKRIGVWEAMSEDSKGLFVKGRLLLEKQIAKDVYIDLKAGALDSMSIGFQTKSDAYDGRRRARILKEVDLREVSLVTVGMNESARVTDVKALGSLSIEEIREIEATLRKKGLSQSDTVKAVSGFKEWLQRDAAAPDTDLRDEGFAGLAALVRRHIAILTS